LAPPGKIARKVLGRYFEPFGNLYRRVFVDLDKIVAYLDQNIPEHAKVLDVGGGDGAVIDRLLDRRPDLEIAMCDLAPQIGEFLSARNRAKVRLFPATDFIDVEGEFDVVTISDVMHHVPVAERARFFEALADACKSWKCRRVIVKDIEPEGLRAALSVLADRYVTGDRHVVLFSRADFARTAVPHFHKARRTSAVPDAPNYCEMLSW
jgi:2-polyprenyl-6-hydroxyphenyl methylase/3-demethylubiquinone-9 3-methyltransferase